MSDLIACDRDGCGNETSRGWLRPTGDTDHRTGLPVVRLFCSRRCADLNATEVPS